MLKSPKCPIRTMARLIGAATVLSGAWIGGALAEDAHVKKMTFDIIVPWKSEITVTSSDGTRWDTIVPGTVTFWAHMVVDTRHPGYVERVGIFLGHCNNTQCGNGFPLLWHDTILERDYNHQAYLQFSADKIPVSTGGIAVVPFGNQILDRCNAKLQPDGATATHSFPMTMTASFSVNTRKAQFEGFFSPVEFGSGFGGGDHTRHADMTVPVNCVGVKRALDRPPTRDQIAVEDIKLFLTTYGNSGSSRPAMGAQCKQLKVTTRVRTDKAGPVNVKLWRKVGGDATTHETKRLEAKALGGGGFGADWDKWESFNRTTYVQYMAEVLGGTFAPSTPWKDITIHCGGNLTDAPKPDQGASPADPGGKRPTVIVTTVPTAPLPHKTAPLPPKDSRPPKISCAGGVVKGDDCVCRPGTKKVQAGAHAFRCQSSTTEPKQLTPSKSTVTDPRKPVCGTPQRMTVVPSARRIVR